jgi:hypothetical protein
MCGIFGKHYDKRFNKKIDRITGLDPAAPFFSDEKDENKLYLTDAEFVDIIHTSEDFGLEKQAAHMVLLFYAIFVCDKI